MASLSPLQEYFLNRTVQSRLALWNALLTVNGIMLTAFSILPVVSPSVNRFVSLILVASCFVSLVLLVRNFLGMKKHYDEVGPMVVSGTSAPSEEKRKEEIKEEKRQHDAVGLVEKVVLGLFFLEIVLSCVLLFLAGG